MINVDTNYYEELASGKITTPEVAICIEVIDRYAPKSTYKFIIPALTPDISTAGDTETDKNFIQRNDKFANETPLEVGNITISNYMSIPVPRELLAYVGQSYSVSGSISGNIAGSGSVGESYINVGGTVSGSGSLTLVPSNRYIPAKSEWVVMFIGGDVNKPRIIAPYKTI